MPNQRPASLRHDSLALERSPEPIADLGSAIEHVGPVGAEDPRKLVLEPHARTDVILGRKSFTTPADKSENVLLSLRRVHPGEPFSEIVAILIDQCKHGRSVPFFEQAKFKV